MNYYQHNIGDYRRDTAHLSLLEHGVYRQLLDTYYLSEQPIPRETEVVFRRLCARTDDERNAIQTVLSEFFTETEDGWFHKRCNDEIGHYKDKAIRAKENGKLGGRPKKTEVVISGFDEKTDSKANHKPITNNQEPITNKRNNTKRLADKPTDVADDVWVSFKTLRNAKKAPVTELAILGIRREAVKAGITLEEAMTICCERGWAGFHADWIDKDKPGNRPSPRQNANSALFASMTHLHNKQPAKEEHHGRTIDVTPRLG